MAIPSIAVPARAQQQQPQQKKDLIDQILRGLQLAQGVTGIAVNTQKFMQEADMAPLQQELAEAKLQQAQTAQESAQFGLEQKQGVAQDKFTGFSQLTSSGLSQVPTGTEGSFQVDVAGQPVNVLPQSAIAQRATQKIASNEAATKQLKDVAKQNKEFGTFLKGRSDRLTLELRPVNSTVGDLNKALASLDKLNDPNLSGAQKVALLQAAQTNAARAVTGPGVLTETEFGRTLSQDYGTQFQRHIFTKIKGDPTPDDIASLRTIVETLATEVQGYGQNISNNIMADVQAQAKFFAPNLAPTDISPEALKDLLPGSSKLAPIRGLEEKAIEDQQKIPAGGPLRQPDQTQAPQPAQAIPRTSIKDLPSLR